jgi:hypothetical protein
VRRDCAYRQAIPKRKFAIDEVSRQANAKIGRNSPTRSAICLDGLVLPGWKPEFHPRQVHADRDDVPEMLGALQIAGIMPAEVAIFGAIDKRGDRFYPAWMSEAPETLLHCRFDVRKRISAAQGVTTEADRFRNLLQEETKTAAVGRERVPVPWHLARVA